MLRSSCIYLFLYIKHNHSKYITLPFPSSSKLFFVILSSQQIFCISPYAYNNIYVLYKLLYLLYICMYVCMYVYVYMCIYAYNNIYILCKLLYLIYMYLYVYLYLYTLSSLSSMALLNVYHIMINASKYCTAFYAYVCIYHLVYYFCINFLYLYLQYYIRYIRFPNFPLPFPPPSR